jgi:hypothetical protein
MVARVASGPLGVARRYRRDCDAGLLAGRPDDRRRGDPGRAENPYADVTPGQGRLQSVALSTARSQPW